ncbi:MAG: hypothetical protein WAM81_00950 [Acidimicrobiia bacterium]
MKSLEPMNGRPGPVGSGGSGANQASSPAVSGSVGSVVVGSVFVGTVVAIEVEVDTDVSRGDVTCVVGEPLSAEHELAARTMHRNQ